MAANLRSRRGQNATDTANTVPQLPRAQSAERIRSPVSRIDTSEEKNVSHVEERVAATSPETVRAVLDDIAATEDINDSPQSPNMIAWASMSDTPALEMEARHPVSTEYAWTVGACPAASKSAKEVDVLDMDDDTVPEFGQDMLEDDIRKTQKLDIVSTIASLKLTTSNLSRMRVPLCRMIPMPMVRPTLACDLVQLENQFAWGYEEGARVFYLSIADESGQTGVFSTEEKEEWGPVWNEVNNKFNAELQSHTALKHLVDHKFYVCDGNHRRIAWMNHINRKHPNEIDWHFAVDSIILDTRGRISTVMQVMHDINQQTENSHVKTNLVHTLYRVKKYGVMDIDKFQELLTPEELKSCQQYNRKSWYSIPLEVFTSFIFKQEISAAADLAVRKYHEDTPKNEVTADGVASAMRKSIKESKSSFRQKLSKIVSVAAPSLGHEFLEEVERHWSLFTVPEMTLEKLQMISSAVAPPEHKVKWLKWMNASNPTREARRFPARPVNEEKLMHFLSRACWYAGLEESALTLFENICKGDKISINMNTTAEPRTLQEYLEDWRMKLWDTAYIGIFKGADAFKKSDSFKDFRGSYLAVQRLIYRYIKLELFAKEAIEKAALPPFLTTWLDRSSADCMFSASQLRLWTTPHLQACPWYIECNVGVTPPAEEALFKKLKDAVDIQPMFDEFAGLDPESRAKAIARREAADKKKDEKLEEARKKTEDNKKRRMAAKALKEEEKSRKRGTKRKAEASIHEPASSAAEMKDTSSGFSLTQEGLAHRLTPVAQNKEPVHDIDECILNLPLGSFCDHKKATDDVDAFLAMHAGDKERFFGGRKSIEDAVDLIIVDVPEGLHVPTVSAPPGPIPKWNEYNSECLIPVFDFAQEYLHDNGGLVVIYPAQSREHRSQLRGCCEEFKFRVLKTYIGSNHLRLTSPLNPSKTTKHFSISLLVKDSGPKTEDDFPFQVVPSFDAVGVTVGSDDILPNYNFQEDISMNGGIPWRGPREKSRQFMQMLIEGMTEPGDVVVDCTASTGSSIHACRATRRHILAFEEDRAIFDALIAPSLRTISVVQPPLPEAAENMLTLEDEDVPVQRIVKTNRFRKPKN